MSPMKKSKQVLNNGDVLGFLKFELVSQDPLCIHPRAKVFRHIPNRRWDKIRYHWEKSMRDICRHPENVREYLVGYRFGTDELLSDHVILRPHTHVVLKRVPMLPHQRHYIPPSCQNKNDDDSIIQQQELENSRIPIEERILMNETCFVSSQNHPLSFHPTWFDDRIVSPNSDKFHRPPARYRCKKCGALEKHWSWKCTYKGKPVNKRKLPSGIPKSLLKKAETEEEKQNAMIDEDGNFVVRHHH